MQRIRQRMHRIHHHIPGSIINIALIPPQLRIGQHIAQIRRGLTPRQRFQTHQAQPGPIKKQVLIMQITMQQHLRVGSTTGQTGNRLIHRNARHLIGPPPQHLRLIRRRVLLHRQLKRRKLRPQLGKNHPRRCRLITKVIHRNSRQPIQNHHRIRVRQHPGHIQMRHRAFLRQ